MSESQQLERIEDKLTTIGADISAIKSNQASDLQRFKQIDERFSTAGLAAAADLKLHASECAVKGQIAKLEKKLDAADNRAKGAWWAGGRMWAAAVAVLVVVDLVYKLYAAAKN
jgi:hypothetical protein